MKNKTKKILKEFSQSFIFYGYILIFFIFIPLFAFYAWVMGWLIRAMAIMWLGYEPIGMNWFVYGIVGGGVSSMIVQGIQEGRKSLKELFKALCSYFIYFALILIALIIWAGIIAFLRKSNLL